MRKLNIKLLSTVSALAFVVAGGAARADVYVSPSIDPANWVDSELWNEANVEGALGAALDMASQLSAAYVVQVGTSANPFTINADDVLSIDQQFWTSLEDTSYWWDNSSGVFIGNGNSISANTTIRDAEISDVNQTAYGTFQTINVDVLSDTDTIAGLTHIDVQQFLDGANEGGYDWNDPSRDVAYFFEIVSRNEIDASASQQGTAVINGLTDDPTSDNAQDMINGLQQAVVSMNTIAVSAADGEHVVVNLGGDSLVGLNDLTDGSYYYGGQGFDVQGLSGGSAYWDVNGHNGLGVQDSEDPFVDYEQFTLESTNWAGAYAPHALTNNDPSVLNLDQKAFVTANTITVGNAVLGDGTDAKDYGTADFTIMATVDENYDPENSGYSLGQFANFNGNDRNLASWDDNLGFGYVTQDPENPVTTGAYYNGDMNYMSEVNVRNTAIATTILDDYAYAAGGADVSGVDLSYDAYNDSLDGGLVDGLDALPNKYTEGYGDVALENIVQVASVGVNAISNIGAGDLKLISGQSFDPENADYVDGTDFIQALDFVQSVNDFVFTNGTVNQGSSFLNNDSGEDFQGPDGFVNTAMATTELGDASVDGVDQTTSFAFNSIRSVGDIYGWTNVDSELTTLDSEDYDAGIVQYADTSFYTGPGNEDAFNGIKASTGTGDANGTDLSQVLSITANTMASNGTIVSDISQTAVGDWFINEPNDIDLFTDNGAVTGDNLSQTALYTANSITTADLVVGEDTPISGGDLVAAYVTQDASGLDLSGYWWGNQNEIDLEGDSVDVGQISQVFQINLNKVAVAGDLSIGAPGDDTDTSLLQQIGTEYDLYVENGVEAGYWDEVTGNVLIGSDADHESIQAAYLNVNKIAVGDTLSGNVEQLIVADDYATHNFVDAYSVNGVVDVTNFTQVAQVNLNEISAGTYADANIDQQIENDLNVTIDNVINSVSDTGSANIQGLTQQAIARINTIGG